jgi:MFS family permease
MGKLIPNAFNLLVIIADALGSTACSYSMAVISSTIGQTQFYQDMRLAPQGEPGYARMANLIGAMNGPNCVGSVFGAVMTSWVADKFGRLRTIQIGAIVMIIGAALCVGSVDVGMLLGARVITGWGIGMLVSVGPAISQ